MSILQYKYKAHRLVNTLFYVIVFVIGFVLGFGAKEIDFSKLLSQVLMIDNVSAYTIYEDDNVKIDEEFIYNTFTENFSQFNLEDYPYIECQKNTIYNNNSNVLVCSAIPYKIVDTLSVSGTVSNVAYDISFTCPQDGCNVLVYYYSYEKYSLLATGIYNDVTNISFTNSYTNFILDGFSDTFINDHAILDFEGINLEFNENLFKDNPDFKEVCVPNNIDFAISTNNYELNENEDSEYYNSKSFSSYEFIWFPYFPKGLVSYLYDNTKENNIWILEEDETYFEMHPLFHYWLNSKEGIDEIYSKEDPGNFLVSLGYEDKYSYYGWYFHPFVVRYADAGLRQFSIFSFKNNIEVVNLDNQISTDYENYCFYIRNDFDITILNTDEFGDQYADIVIMGDEKLNISTSHNAANLDSKGLFEKVKVFLNKMTNPINFVKDYIYDLYESMPMLLKLFIISVFGLVVIKILIGMVVK